MRICVQPHRRQQYLQGDRANRLHLQLPGFLPERHLQRLPLRQRLLRHGQLRLLRLLRLLLPLALRLLQLRHGHGRWLHLLLRQLQQLFLLLFHHILHRIGIQYF